MTKLRWMMLGLALVGCRKTDPVLADGGTDAATDVDVDADPDADADADDAEAAVDATDADRPDVLAFAPTSPFAAPGLYGGWITSLAVDGHAPGTVYAAGPFADVFKSVDGGGHWNACGPDLWADSLTIDPGFAGRVIVVSRTRVLLSEDACSSWREIGIQPWKTLTGLSTIERVVFSPSKPNVVYAQSLDPCRVDCVYRSDDGARRWRRMYGSPGGELSVSSTDADVLIVTGREKTDAVTKRSTDGGKSWSLVAGEHVPAHVFASTAASPIFAFGDHAIVSRDNGNTWGAWPEGPNAPLGVFPDPQHPATLLAIESPLDETIDPRTVLLRTDDVDTGWELLDGAAPRGPRAIAWDPNDVATAYLAAGEYGVLATHDKGTTWDNVSVGITALDIGSFSIAPSNSRTMYASTGRGLVVSHDGGTTWRTLFEPGDPAGDVAIDPLDDARVWLVADAQRVVYVHHDLLESPGGFVGKGVGSVAVATDGSRTLFVGDDDGLHRSDDGGLTWVLLPAVTANPARIGQILAISSDRIVVTAEDVASGKSSVLGTTNGGTSWRVFPIGEPLSAKGALAGVNASPRTILVSVSDPETTSKLMRTTDAGLSWSEVLAHGTTPVISRSDASTAYAMTPEGVARSRDAGATWSTGAKGTPGTGTLAIDPNDENLLWAGFAGAFVSRDGGMTFTKWR